VPKHGRRVTNEFGETNQEEFWNPTPEEIAAECKKIRAENDAKERKANEQVAATVERESLKHSKECNVKTLARYRALSRRYADK
jgi:hypothetical protein